MVPFTEGILYRNFRGRWYDTFYLEIIEMFYKESRLKRRIILASKTDQIHRIWKKVV